jgi:hypothetical protein
VPFQHGNSAAVSGRPLPIILCRLSAQLLSKVFDYLKYLYSGISFGLIGTCDCLSQLRIAIRFEILPGIPEIQPRVFSRGRLLQIVFLP